MKHVTIIVHVSTITATYVCIIDYELIVLSHQCNIIGSQKGVHALDNN